MLGISISIPALLGALLLFGFAPGAALRVIILAFPADDPRRQELRAELYAVPRIERPVWVFEQIEVAIAEGLWPRVVWAATGRIIYRWHLGSGVKLHQKNPETFWIPSISDKESIDIGDAVKLSFQAGGRGERMWVIVTEIKGNRMVGYLSNSPWAIPRLEEGDTIKFRPDHVLDIWPVAEQTVDEDGEKFEPEPANICPCCFFTRNDPE